MCRQSHKPWPPGCFAARLVRVSSSLDAASVDERIDLVDLARLDLRSNEPQRPRRRFGVVEHGLDLRQLAQILGRSSSLSSSIS
jgi:hypothetical protein